MKGNPYRYIPTEEEFTRLHIRRAKATLEWLSKFDIQQPILEYSARTPFTKMLEERYGPIENFDSEEPDNAYPPWKEHKFKTVFCFDVIEHMMDPLFIFKRIQVCIALDGHLFVTIPARIKWPFRKEEHSYHEMDVEDIRNIIKRAKFKEPEIEVKKRTGMRRDSNIINFFEPYFRRRIFIHARCCDWSREHWWD